MYVASASHTVNMLHVTRHYHTVANQPPAANHNNDEMRGGCTKVCSCFLSFYLHHHTDHIPCRRAIANQSPSANNNKTRGRAYKGMLVFPFFISMSPHQHAVEPILWLTVYFREIDIRWAI